MAKPDSRPFALYRTGISLLIIGPEDAPLWVVTIPTRDGGRRCCEGHTRWQDAADHGASIVRDALTASLSALPPDSYGARVLPAN